MKGKSSSFDKKYVKIKMNRKTPNFSTDGHGLFFLKIAL